MLHIHSSNRLEFLLEAMTQAMSSPVVDDPFVPVTVVVQNSGMARWVSQQIARSQGISAHFRFETPGVFLWSAARAWIPGLPEHPHRKEVMMWQVFCNLPELLVRPEFTELARYLATDHASLQRLQLAQQIANTYDRYLIYRPDTINHWEGGGDTHWQAHLWRQISNGIPQHWGTIHTQLNTIATQVPAVALPQRISVFGISDMPPLYTQVLTAIAMHTSVDLYYLNPCEQYWADIIDEKQQAQRRARARKAGLDDPTGLLDVGNPLLASWGHAGQAFLDQLLELNVTESEAFYRPAEDTCLQQLQTRILDLSDDKPQSERQDSSIQVHSAHSRLREVQILHDQLLRAFDTIADIKPADIIVMAPDIDRYAPFVDATFSLAQDESYIPWSISDRRFRAEQQLLETLGWLLNLPLSRFESSEILSLLDLPAVRRKFTVDNGTVQTIQRWVRESGIRWSLDSAMRESFELPASELNSWRFGLQRLFLGFALPDMDGELYDNIAPYPHVEGAQSVQLEVLAQLIELCAKWRSQLSEEHTVAQWLEILDQLRMDFFAADDSESQVLQTAHSKFYELISGVVDSSADIRLSREVIAELFHQVLEDDSSEHHFLTGRVTFSNMVPMRSIPFRMVCILGMNAEDFPRSDNTRSFDLIAAAPRRGDRRRRNDDRYLFLEALLSARDVFYVSYLGRDLRDNSKKAVSTVVAELIDYTGVAVTEHPLQAFSSRYFDASNAQLFSYKQHWYEAACACTELQVQPFFSESSALFARPAAIVHLMELVSYFVAPSEALLRHGLEVRPGWQDDELESVESFTVEGLLRWKLKQQAYAMYNKGDSKQTVKQKLLAYGELPAGPIGDRELASIYAGSLDLDKRVLKYKTREIEARDFDLTIGDFRLQGRLHDIRSGGLFIWRFGKLRSKDLLTGWIRHLVLCCLSPGDVAARTILVFENWTVEFKQVTAPKVHLQKLLEIRAEGLSRPLPWFPKSALSKQISDSSLQEAVAPKWQGPSAGVALEELGEAGFATVWRGRNPFDATFEQLSKDVMEPLLEHAGFVDAELDAA